MPTLKAAFTGLDAVGAASAVVDSAAEKARKRLATSIYGQDTLYLQKAIDADRFTADGTVSQLIEADMDAYGVGAATAVDQIKAARDEILSTTKKVETIRLKAKQQIRQTTDNPFDIAKQAKADIDNL